MHVPSEYVLVMPKFDEHIQIHYPQELKSTYCTFKVLHQWISSMFHQKYNHFKVALPRGTNKFCNYLKKIKFCLVFIKHEVSV